VFRVTLDYIYITFRFISAKKPIWSVPSSWIRCRVFWYK